MSFPANAANTWAVGVGAIVGEAGGLPTGMGGVDCASRGGELVRTGTDRESVGAVVTLDVAAVDVISVDLVAVDVAAPVEVRACCEDRPELCAPWHPKTPNVMIRATGARKRVLASQPDPVRPRTRDRLNLLTSVPRAVPSLPLCCCHSGPLAAGPNGRPLGQQVPGKPDTNQTPDDPSHVPGRTALAVLGLVLAAAAVDYFTHTAGALPSFLPGHQAGSTHHHTKHGVVGWGGVGSCCAESCWRMAPVRQAGHGSPVRD